jgi:PAS domain S-box-containing protein
MILWPPTPASILEAAEATIVMGLAAIDNDGRQTYVSPAFCRMVGYARDELIGARAPFAYWPAEELDAIEHAFALTVQGRAPEAGFELSFTRKDGQRFWVQLGIVPMFDCGERIGWLASFFEIEERKQLAEERAERKRQQAARDAADAERLRLTEILDHIPTGITIADATGATIYANRRAEQIFGGPMPLPDTTEAYSSTYSCWHPDGRAMDSREFPLVRALHGEIIDGQEVLFRKATGDLAIVHVHAAPIRDRAGVVVAAVTSYYDITERRALLESEQLARQASERARHRMAFLDGITTSLVRDLDDPVSAVDRLARLVVPELADWCTVYVPREDGKVGAIAVGHSDPAMAAAGFEMLRQHPLDPELSWGIPKVLRTGCSEITDITDDLLIEASQGNEHLAALRASGMISHLAVPLTVHGTIIGCLGLTNTTSGRRFGTEDLALAEEVAVRAALAIERARLYQEMRRARAEAEAASRAKDVFLAMLGHELRNPLAPILTALQLMRLRDGDTALKERAVIERQVTHLVRLVDDLLDVSRITRGKIELAKQPTEIAEIIAKAIEMSSTLLEQQRHRLSVVVPATGLRVDGDHARLAQVFCNLVTNAAKYTRPGGHVHVAAQRDGDDVVVRVQDDGEGIDPALLPHVFDLFEQGERTLDRARGGLGIGLTIVKTLVELHGGRVLARSEGLGRGSELEVRLPASCRDGPEDAAAPARRPHAIAGHRAVRVLLVDDNQDAVMILSDALNALGYETRVAYDGPSGIVAAAEFLPAVAMLDIGLPVMDGYELARRLRERVAGLQLIAMTGYGQEADRHRSRDAGFLHHLVKPIDLEQVATILDGFGE